MKLSAAISKKINILLALIALLIGAAFFVFFYWNSLNGHTPVTNEGQKWRVGYYEGGAYKDYQTYLMALIKGLEQLGWVAEFKWPVLKANDDTKVIWDFLAQIDSDYIKFVKEAYWSADWYDEQRLQNKRAAVFYLQQRQLDLIIAGGTWGGLDLADYTHNVPTLVISTSDPVLAGIIASAEDSGYDHVHAVCDPYRYQRQLRAFHNIIGFDKLGVVYEDTEDGRVYAALHDVTKIAVEKGFEIVPCIAPDAGRPELEAMQGVLKCHETLAPQVGAVYITAHRGVNPKWMPKVLEPLFKYGVPTFAQEGPDQVKNGVLLSIARVEVEAMGLFQATVMAKIFNGTKPRDIPQIFEEQKRIVINRKTAEIINYPIPQAVIDAADRVYEKITHESTE